MGGGKRVKPDVHRHALADDMESPWNNGVRPKPRDKRRKQRDGGDAPSDDDAALPADVSAKVLAQARVQQAEVEAEARGTTGLAGRGSRAPTAAAPPADSDDESASSLSDGGGDPWSDGEVEVSPEDEAAIAAFLAPGAADHRQRTLADVILDKLKEQEGAGGEGAGVSGPPTPGAPPAPAGIDDRVAEVYRGVGRVMARYTAGAVPKAFKVIPSLRNWEDVLYLTEPQDWSPHATYVATKTFVSNLNSKMAQRFLALVLLPAVRADVRANGRLHFALFQAMKKAAYKPDAFYKGLLLPLCASGTCSLREAVIVEAVLKRVSLPVLHSAAALLRVADLPYSGTNSFFVRALLDKKYALPYRVVDALVDHFVRFTDDARQLPVVWHQSLLVFVQRYGHEIREEDRPVLVRLMKRQYHHAVTPEAQRALAAARTRGQVAVARAVQRPGLGTAEDPRALPPVELMEDD